MIEPKAGEVWCGHGDAVDQRVLIRGGVRRGRVTVERLTGQANGKVIRIGVDQLRIAFRPLEDQQ